MANPTDFLTWNVPIVDTKSGYPTPTFIRWFQQFRDGIGGAVTTSRKILTGKGLSGGGDLSQDLTLSLNAGLADLNDVDITTVPPTDGQVLKYVLADDKWEPGVGGGGGGGGSIIGYARDYTTVSQPSNTSDPGLEITGMNVVCTAEAGFLKISWALIAQMGLYPGANQAQKRIIPFIDGVAFSPTSTANVFLTSNNEAQSGGSATTGTFKSAEYVIVPITAGSHTISLHYNDAWQATGVNWFSRAMIVEQVEISSGGGGGSGGGGVPTIIQKAFARFQTNNTITLPAAPTPGNTLLLMSTGAGGSPAGIPAGFTPIGYSAVGNNVPPPGNGQQFQHSWAATKAVVTGDPATWNIGTADWCNLALYELQGPVSCDYISSGMTTSGSAFKVSPALPRMGGGLRFVFVEQDAANDLTFDAIGGLSTEHQFTDASSGNNHRALLGLVATGFAGMVTGMSSSYTYPQYTLVSAST